MTSVVEFEGEEVTRFRFLCGDTIFGKWKIGKLKGYEMTFCSLKCTVFGFSTDFKDKKKPANFDSKDQAVKPNSYEIKVQMFLEGHKIFKP